MPRGSCSTTGIIWYMGEDSLPKVRFRTQAFKYYFRYLREHEVTHERIEHAWIAIKADLDTFSKPWRQVSGPCGSIILSVYELGWQPTQALKWESGEDTLEYDRAVPIACMVEEVKSILIGQAWLQASRHYAGKGMQQGIDLTILRSKAKEYEAQGQMR